MAMYRTVLADDHGVLRAGLRALLDDQPDVEVVGEAETADGAVELVRRLQPDIAVLDVRMPGDGLVAAQQMKQEFPKLGVIILSQYDDPAYVHRALVAGASGYALKRSSGHELIDAIRVVARGQVYLHPAVARTIVERRFGPRQPAQEEEVRPASRRERQVLRMVALGHTTEQIATELFLSVRTVETYKMRSMQKLGLSGRAAVVRYAMEHGLLENEPESEE